MSAMAEGLEDGRHKGVAVLADIPATEVMARLFKVLMGQMVQAAAAAAALAASIIMMATNMSNMGQAEVAVA
jgi:hypothetical protein